MAIFSRGNEVALHVSNSSFFVDIPRSFVDGPFVLNPRINLFLSPSFGRELLSVRFDLPSVRTSDVCSDGHSGNGWQVTVIFFNAFSGQFR